MSAPTPAPTAVSLLVMALLCFVSGDAAVAQVSTATIQGTVSDATGVLPGATITAREEQSGFTHETVSGADGTFTLAGLRPGRYEITLSISPFKPQARTVQLLVGQTVSVDFALKSDLAFAEAVTVVSDWRVEDIKTTEITTNVTQEQLLYLPQNSRNFLNFAALAPGLRVSHTVPQRDFPRARCLRRT